MESWLIIFYYIVLSFRNYGIYFSAYSEKAGYAQFNEQIALLASLKGELWQTE